MASSPGTIEKRAAEEQAHKDTTPKQPRAVVHESAKVLDKAEIASTRWLGLHSLKWVDRFGVERGWDMCSRTTKKPESYADAVVIFCVLSGGGLEEPHILLVKQFRPPIEAYTIEMPAGLIDPGETPETAALRELKEECGYVGKASSKSPGLCLSPGLSNETAAFVRIDIDLDEPANQSPKQDLEDSEDIAVLQEPLSTLVARLDVLASEGCCIFMALYSIAMALQVSQKLSL